MSSISSPLHMHLGEGESFTGANMTDERSAFENASPTRSPSHLLQPTSISSLPLMQAIFPSEE